MHQHDGEFSVILAYARISQRQADIVSIDYALAMAISSPSLNTAVAIAFILSRGKIKTTAIIKSFNV